MTNYLLEVGIAIAVVAWCVAAFMSVSSKRQRRPAAQGEETSQSHRRRQAA